MKETIYTRDAASSMICCFFKDSFPPWLFCIGNGILQGEDCIFIYIRSEDNLDELIKILPKGYSGFDIVIKLVDSLDILHISRFFEDEEAKRIHSFSDKHRHSVEKSESCRCFYCLQTFEPKDIKEWIDKKTTALCPKCGIDSVLCSEDVEFSEDLFYRMNMYWFRVEKKKGMVTGNLHLLCTAQP